MADEEKEDRISSLPDCLLVEIITRIKVPFINYYYYPGKEDERIMNTKELIKTTTAISKRWQYLWTKLPILVCQNYYEFACIHKTLTQCPTDVKLNKFELSVSYSIQDTSQVNNWIRYAITRNVQEVNISLWDYSSGDEFSYYDDLFFNNSCIIRMKLFSCVFSPPNGTIRWDKLKFLCIQKGKLVGDSVGKILSGSPCLETLELDDCYGVSRIEATSKRFKNLVLTNYGKQYRHDMGDYIDTMEINAPHMLSLTITGKFCLEKLMLLNVFSLVKADFQYLSSNHFADNIRRTRDYIEEKLLQGLLSRLGHVNDITLGDYNCLDALSRLEATGFQFRKGSDLRGSYPYYYKVFSLTDVAAAADTKTEEKVEEKRESKTEEKVEEKRESMTKEKVEETEESDLDRIFRLFD